LTPVESRTVAVSESDDEFCDTSAEMTNPTPRRRDFSGSQSTSTLSSVSLSASPYHVTGIYALSHLFTCLGEK